MFLRENDSAKKTKSYKDAGLWTTHWTGRSTRSRPHRFNNRGAMAQEGFLVAAFPT
jgi:hypothetical protein